MTKKLSALLLAAAAASLTSIGAADAAPRLSPKRLSSVGDSISEAINAEWFDPTIIVTPNHWASWVNGYHGFWEDVLGKTDVYSYNQRISRNFGSSNRANYMESLSGADSYDIPAQTAQSVSHSASFVTVFMGHNDVCQSSFADIPTDQEFEANVRAGLNNLKNGLPAGATIYVVGLVDIYKLYQLGEQKSALGMVDCEAVWAATLFDAYPCSTMLSPLNSEADRQYTRGRNIVFNQLLERLVLEYGANDPNHYYHFTDTPFNYNFTPSQVSDYDCFHPSASGQKEIARITWNAGPFASYQN